MDALDLTKTPPRSPRVRLGGMVLLARTIDKLRATLPGGNIGAYQISGFSARMFETLGITESDVRAVVALAANDDEVVQWVLKHTTAEQREKANAAETALRISDRIEQPGWLERYPIARTLPPETTLFELLEHDDAAAFATHT